jgi:hypothetical protein
MTALLDNSSCEVLGEPDVKFRQHGYASLPKMGRLYPVTVYAQMRRLNCLARCHA